MAIHTAEIEIENHGDVFVTTEDIVNILSCESGGFDYWAEICWDSNAYEAARQRCKQRPAGEFETCYEDVLADILEHEDKLTVYDREENQDHDLTLDALLRAVGSYLSQYKGVASNQLEDYDIDGSDADSIIQIAVFGDVIYG